jgi:hypothetical protein
VLVLCQSQVPAVRLPGDPDASPSGSPRLTAHGLLSQSSPVVDPVPAPVLLPGGLPVLYLVAESLIA